jgi:hypothetical protein
MTRKGEVPVSVKTQRSLQSIKTTKNDSVNSCDVNHFLLAYTVLYSYNLKTFWVLISTRIRRGGCSCSNVAVVSKEESFAFKIK